MPGLVPTRTFYGSLAERRFLSTQYVRHPSVPLYTPEPDIVHEVIGHANMLASPVFADLYELAGQASRRAESPEALEFFSRVFWFSVEFGVVWEGGELRTYGAGILSSFGELDAFRGGRDPSPRPGGDGHPAATTSPTTSRSCSPARASPTSSTCWASFFSTYATPTG